MEYNSCTVWISLYIILNNFQCCNFHYYLNTKKMWIYSELCVSSVAQSCPAFCDPMDCSTPGFPVHHQFPELAQPHVHLVSDAIQPFHPLIPFSSCLQSSSGSFPRSQFFALGSKVLKLQVQHQFFQ